MIVENELNNRNGQCNKKRAKEGYKVEKKKKKENGKGARKETIILKFVFRAAAVAR